MHGFDTVIYGANLANYFHRELASPPRKMPLLPPARRIPFWSDIAEDHARAFPDNYPSMENVS
jgi:hypothetical protein